MANKDSTAKPEIEPPHSFSRIPAFLGFYSQLQPVYAPAQASGSGSNDAPNGGPEDGADDGMNGFDHQDHDPDTNQEVESTDSSPTTPLSPRSHSSRHDSVWSTSRSSAVSSISDTSSVPAFSSNSTQDSDSVDPWLAGTSSLSLTADAQSAMHLKDIHVQPRLRGGYLRRARRAYRHTCDWLSVQWNGPNGVPNSVPVPVCENSVAHGPIDGSLPIPIGSRASPYAENPNFPAWRAADGQDASPSASISAIGTAPPIPDYVPPSPNRNASRPPIRAPLYIPEDVVLPAPIQGASTSPTITALPIPDDATPSPFQNGSAVPPSRRSLEHVLPPISGDRSSATSFSEEVSESLRLLSRSPPPPYHLVDASSPGRVEEGNEEGSSPIEHSREHMENREVVEHENQEDHGQPEAIFSLQGEEIPKTRLRGGGSCLYGICRFAAGHPSTLKRPHGDAHGHSHGHPQDESALARKKRKNWDFEPIPQAPFHMNWQNNSQCIQYTNVGYDRFFSKSGTAKPPSPALSQLFDKYREPLDEDADHISVNGCMKYFGELNVGLDEPAMLAVSTLVKSPSMGEMARADFIAGWDSRQASNIARQKAVVQEMRNQLAGGADPDFFRQVYKHAFQLAKQQGQRAVMLEPAGEFWGLLMGENGGLGWKTSRDDWLALWIEFLNSEWKKSVSKDLWDQTLSFAKKTLEDDTLSWWSEEAAWPGVIDDFVAWIKVRRDKENQMDTA